MQDLRDASRIWATGDFFEVLGVPAIIGRTFVARDERRITTGAPAFGRHA